MAKHEFGIMEEAPRPGQRFDAWEPEKYGCVSVDDELVEPILMELCACATYSHALEMEYAGVTLIPPESLSAFRRATEGKRAWRNSAPCCAGRSGSGGS